MIRLYAEQLGAQLQKSLYPCYLLFGNDPLLLQESQARICDRAQAQYFDEHFSFTLEASTDWDVIFSLCQARSLFASRQTLLLVLPDGNIQASIEKKLLQLASLLHKDLLLILCGNKLTSTLENSAWFKALSSRAVLVSCTTPAPEKLPYWVARYAKSMKLTLDEAACQILCYCYEGNLLALVQVLEQLSLIYPDSCLTLSQVEAAVNDAAHFTTFYWVEAALTGKSKRAAHILRQLRLEATDPVILLRGMQREILQLLTLKRQMGIVPIYTLFNRHKVWWNRRPLFTQALGRLTLPQLRCAVALMTKIELALKQDYGYPVWSDLNALALLLCGKMLLTAMLDV